MKASPLARTSTLSLIIAAACAWTVTPAFANDSSEADIPAAEQSYSSSGPSAASPNKPAQKSKAASSPCKFSTNHVDLDCCKVKPPRTEAQFNTCIIGDKCGPQPLENGPKLLAWSDCRVNHENYCINRMIKVGCNSKGSH